MVEIVSVTRKGQATIPKRLREKYGIKRKVLIEEDERGILLRPVPSPSDDLGSLKPIFKGKTSRELLEEARKEEFKREEGLMKHVGEGSIRL
ncbi:MAG: AbrB/MazE/SpoVT family DNA-binding domain-containing protein [Candidatus Methanomethyliales bacterium]|nr:AbrB/MazE/SpoVT family DNA-binding domain-containing protein [Candidatus Methanomethylicales archaeon]